MLKGDLTSTPLAPLLRDLAEDSATGCLHVTNPADEEALIFYKNGLVYSVAVPGSRPQLGAKLVSSGALAPEALAEALEAQRSELQGWRLGELLVHLGYVDQPVVEAFVMEQVTEALWDLLRWTDGRWKFRKNIKTREDVGPPMVVVELLATLRDRGYEWETISAVVHGPTAVPVLSARGDGAAETTLDNDAWSMLCKIDGERSVADLARDCGYTLFEAGQVIVSLVEAGLVDIDEDIDLAGSELYGATTLSSALAGDLDGTWADELDQDGQIDDEAAARAADDANDDVLTRLAQLVNEVAGDHSHDHNGDGAGHLSDESTAADPAPALTLAPPNHSGVTSFDNPMIVPLHRHSTEPFAASIARVSNALADVLGATPDTAESDGANRNQPVALKRRSSTSDPEWQRRKRLRSAAAAELASAQALVETLRSDTGADDTAAPEPFDQAQDAEDQSAAAATALQAEQAEAERLAAEQAEAEWLAAQQAEAERLAAEEAERLAAEEAEAERVAAEQAEAEWLAAQQAEAERVAAEEAERLAAEEAERLATEEADRVAAEQAEAEWLAAQQAEAERVATEEADRVAAEQAEAEWLAAQQAEAERVAAEEAERLAAEQAEAERLATEEADRVAAEQAEAEWLAAQQAEAERVAAEEAERLAAEQAEAERLATEEADRVAAEQAEAEWLAAQQAEAERVAAEEAERLAAEQAEAERLATEEEAAHADLDEGGHDARESKADRAARRKAEKLAAEQDAIRADEAAAATAMLVQLAASSSPDPVDDAAPADAVSDSYTDIDSQVTSFEDAEPETPWTEAGQADTAALLRELSSLGIDDDGPSAPAAPHKPRPASTDKKAKKKIGLFGR